MTNAVQKTSTFNIFALTDNYFNIVLCRRLVYSDLRRLKKLGASGFFGGPVTVKIYWASGSRS